MQIKQLEEAVELALFEQQVHYAPLRQAVVSG
jgi:hypothetical protein